MKRLELTDRIRTSPRSQRFSKTETFKAFNSQQDDLIRYNTNFTDFQFLQTQSKSLHRSLSSKNKLFKSAKKVETYQRKRSNSFKNFSSHTSENFSKKLSLNPSKQFTIPTKSMKLEGGSIINDKKAVEDIMSRLRNKNSIRIEVKNELIINEMKSKNFFKEQNKEPQLNLKDLIKDQVTKRIQEQQQSIKQNQQITKMKSIMEEKQSHFKKLQGKIGSKINWISQKMEEFQERETKIKEKQENIIKKEKQIQANLLKKIQEKNKRHQEKLQKQFQEKLNQIKAQQNLQNIQSQSQIISQIQSLQKNQIQLLNQSIKSQNNRDINRSENLQKSNKNTESQKNNKNLNQSQSHTNNKPVSLNYKKQQIPDNQPKNMKQNDHQILTKKKQKQEKLNQHDYIDIDKIKEISSVQKPMIQTVKFNQSQNVKQQPKIVLKKQKNVGIQPPKQKNANIFSQNQKIIELEDDVIEELEFKTQTKKPKIQQQAQTNQQRLKLQQNSSNTKTKENMKQKEQNQGKNKSLQDKQLNEKKQPIISSNSKQPKSTEQGKKQKQQNPPAKQPSKNKEQKIKITEYLKVLNRVTSLLYFIGQIPHHCSSNMKKNKKYQFKVANLYLFKYVYDKFRFIQKVFQGLLNKKFITDQYHTKRVKQNQTMKETYAKLKAYVYKKQPCPPKQAESFLNQNLNNLCFEDKTYFNHFLFKEIRNIVDFYYKDTMGKWTDHKVNLCYFRMLIAVFMIQEIEFNLVLIDPEQNEHPDYMINEIQKFTEDDLKTKMTEAYQLFNDIDFAQQN